MAKKKIASIKPSTAFTELHIGCGVASHENTGEITAFNSQNVNVSWDDEGGAQTIDRKDFQLMLDNKSLSLIPATIQKELTADAIAEEIRKLHLAKVPSPETVSRILRVPLRRAVEAVRLLGPA